MLFYNLKEKTGYSRSQFKTLLKRNGFKVRRDMFTDYYYTTRNCNCKWEKKSQHSRSDEESYCDWHHAIWINNRYVFRIQRITKFGGAINTLESEKFKIGSIVIYRTEDFDVLRTSKWRRYEYEVFLFDDFVNRFCKRSVKKSAILRN